MNEPRKSRINYEMVVAVSAVVVGVSALFVSLYETHLMRREQQASVIPFLDVGRNYFEDDDGRQRLQLLAENSGLGPARIEGFRVTIDEVSQRSWGKAIQMLIRRDEPISYRQSTINGRIIPAGRQIIMFDLNEMGLASEIASAMDRFDMEACYCSVFDECFVSRYSSLGDARPVANCHTFDDTFEQ